MENEDAVTQPAEQTAQTESAPVETNGTATPQESADTTVEPENKVSESVPYDRFKEVNSKAKTLEEENAWLKSQMNPQPVEPMANVPQLDPDSEVAVRATARQEWDEMERQKFVSKHNAELTNDPILAGTIRELIARENKAGRMADREQVYEQAKKMLDEKIKPVATKAQTEGFKEGQEKAVQKTQAGAVGNPGYKEPEQDDSQLSAAELAKKYDIPRY